MLPTYIVSRIPIFASVRTKKTNGNEKMHPFTDKDLPSCQDVKDFWQEIKQDSRPIIVYGTGNGADKLSEYLSLYGREISDFFAPS